MASDERVRIEVGFDGGQIMSAVVTANSAEELERTFQSEPGGAKALALDAEDGRYTVALGRVVYVKRFSRESRVGFGAS